MKKNNENDVMRLCFNRTIGGHLLELAKLYTAFSNPSATASIAAAYPFDRDLCDLIGVLEEGIGQTYPWNYSDPQKTPVEVPHTDTIVVCFSGGRDSTATAMLYKEKGLDVHLYHVRGINRSYPEEERSATDVARHLGLPMTVEEVRQKGWSAWPDNPVKNQVLASMAMDFAVREGLGCDVAVGDTYMHTTKNSSFGEEWSDNVEMWREWEKWMQGWLPGCRVHLPFRDQTETMNMVTTDMELMPLMQSCVLPYRFREMTRRRNEAKYGVSLLQHRCGSCWKCCSEYIRLCDSGLVPLSPPFYLHCLSVLLRCMPELKPAVRLDNCNELERLEKTYREFLFGDFRLTEYYRQRYGTDRN